MPHVLVAGPAPWNILVRVATLPDANPQTIFASGHHDTAGGTSAGKALGLARLGVDVTLRTVLGDDDAATRARAALARPSGAATGAMAVASADLVCPAMTADAIRRLAGIDA